ncbi:MAG: PAS sensor protein [Desulfobulbus sp.]|nr:MAG: PAS sensor protein [Desulfobulbus sp.]
MVDLPTQTLSPQTKEQGFLKVFKKVTRLISMVLDHQQVMDTIVSSLPDLLDIDACTIRLLDAGTNTFVLGAAHGLSLEYLSRKSIDTEETMEMIKSGYPVAKVDLDEDPTYLDRDAAAKEGIKSVLTLPILFQDSIIGIMRLLTKSQRLFTAEEISFSMALAEQVGVAISNGRMFKEMANQVDFMNEVQKISRMVNSTLDMDSVLNTIVQRVPVSMDAKGCTLRLFNSLTNQLELVASYGVSEKYLKQSNIEDEKNVTMVLTGEPVAIYDVASDDRVLNKKNMMEEGINSLLAVPIKVGKEIIGVLRIFSEKHHSFTSTEVNFAVTVAEAGGTAIQNARMYQKINLLFNQIEENERFLSDILDCIRPELLVVDKNRHVVLANKVCQQRLGLEEADILGMEYHELCSANEDDSACPVDDVLRTGKPATYEHKVKLEDGEHWLERTASPMFDDDGNVEFVIEIIRDITTKRALEKEQMERVELQGVVELAGTVAHEINTPLFAALGTAQILEEDIEKQELIADVQTIIRNLKNISELTKKMTDMTGFERKDYVGEANIVEFK